MIVPLTTTLLRQMKHTTAIQWWPVLPPIQSCHGFMGGGDSPVEPWGICLGQLVLK